MLASRIYPYYGPGAACRQAGYIVDQVQNTDKLYICTMDQGQQACCKLDILWTRGSMQAS